MKIKMWTKFSKRKNSTKQPTGGTEINVRLKDNTSVENPVFIVSGAIPDFVYVEALGHYYFVDDVVNINRDMCEVHCSQDVLATYKSDILGYTAFVERAASLYDADVNDPLLSISQKPKAIDTTDTDISTFFGSGCFISEVLAKDQGIVIYATDDLEPYKYILTPGIYTPQDKAAWITSQISQAFDLDVYVGTVKWIPFDAGDIGSLLVNTFPIGPVDIADALGGSWDYTVYKVYQSSIKVRLVTLTLPSTGIYGDFRDFSPRFNTYLLRLPGVGIVQIPSEIIGYAIRNTKDIGVQICVDFVSGEISYNVGIIESTKNLIFARFSGNISVDVPIGKSSVDTVGSAKMFADSVASGAAMGGVWGAVGGAVAGAVQVIYNEMTPSSSMMVGGRGNKAEITTYRNSITLIRTQYEAKDYVTSVAGRPLMQNVLLNNLSGYVKCGNASVPISGRDSDRMEINGYLNSGFYIE